MDPIHPWLDPVEVRRLAERLLVPAATAPLTKPDAGFAEDFVGFAAAAPAMAVKPAIPAVPPVAPVAESVFPAPQAEPPPSPPSAPIVSEKEAEAVSPPEEPVTPTRSPFLDRVVRFRNWLAERFSATGIFILDREGAVIFDESGHGKLHFLARSLAQASRRPGSSSGNVHVKIGPGSVLEVIPVETPYGCLVLGAVVHDSLPPDQIQVVMDALSLAASPPAAD